MADKPRITEDGKESEANDQTDFSEGKAEIIPNSIPVKYLATWETDFGRMSLFRPPYDGGIDGFYYDSKTEEMDGIVRAEYAKNSLTGFWIQSTSDKKCNVKKFGTYYWGRLWFDVHGNTFSGRWGYCEEVLGSDWNGKLLRKRG